MAPTSPNATHPTPESRDLTEWSRLDDTDQDEQEEHAERRWKGKGKDTNHAGTDLESGISNPVVSHADEDTIDGSGRRGSYPPLSEEVEEERAVVENLKRWENAERLRRKAVRESRSMSTSSAPSPITELSRRASQILFRRSTGSKRDSATRLRTDSPTPLDDLEQQRNSSHLTRTQTDDTARNPFRDPAAAASDAALMSPATGDPFQPSTSRVQRSDSVSTVTGGTTPVQPTPQRPVLQAMGSSYVGDGQERAHAPTPRPLDLPTTPAPQHLYEGGGIVPAPVSGREGMRIRRTLAERQEEEEELERERRDGRWWTDWLCGLKEKSDPSGQGGRTNPFE